MYEFGIISKERAEVCEKYVEYCEIQQSNSFQT